MSACVDGRQPGDRRESSVVDEERMGREERALSVHRHQPEHQIDASHNDVCEGLSCSARLHVTTRHYTSLPLMPGLDS